MDGFDPQNPQNQQPPVNPDPAQFTQPVSDINQYSQTPIQSEASQFTQPVSDINQYSQTPIQPEASQFTQPVSDANQYSQAPTQPEVTQYAQPQPDAGQFAQSQPIFSQGGTDRADYMQPLFMPAPEDNGPKKKRFKVWPIIVIAAVLLVVAAGVIGFLMKDVISNSIAKASKSPEDYMRYVVEKQPWDKAIDGYDAACKQMEELDDMKIEGEVRLEMGDDMLELIEDGIVQSMSRSYYYMYNYNGAATPDLRLDAWQDIALKFESSRTDDGIYAKQAVQLKDKEPLLTFEEMYDNSKSTAYLRIPEVNEDYAALKLSNFFDDDEMDIVNQLLAKKNSLSALPSGKVLKEMQSRYIGAILDQIKDVEEDDDTLQIGGESMKCTVLSFALDEDLQKDIYGAIIDELRKDSDLEDAFYNFMKETSMSSADLDADEIWDEILKGLDNAEKKLDDYSASSEPDVYLYVDNKGKIVGLKIEEGKNEMLAGYIVKGNRIWAEYSLDSRGDSIAVRGEGKVGVSGVDMECEFTADIDGEELELPFRIEKFGVNGGTFRMDTEPLCDMISDASRSADTDKITDMLEGELVIESTRKDTEIKSAMYIDNDGDKTFGISYTIKLSKAGAIEFPSNKQTVKINSEMELLPYLADCDLDALVDIIEKLGVPEDLTEELRSSMSMISSFK